MIAATIALVEEAGPEGVTVREAARRAGVSSGAPFRHFPNKTALMTAVAEDHQVAMSMGISVQRSIAFAWILGSILSTLGAMVHLSGRSINMLSSDIGLAALPVALLAGLESLAGLLLAGVLVGVIQGLASAYLDPLVGGAIGSVFPFIIMLLMLLIRPTGMFGWKTIERV